jgi:hypothetical protein
VRLNKRLLTSFYLLNLFFSLSYADLNKKEAQFIQKNSVNSKIKNILNTIFSSFDIKLNHLLDGTLQEYPKSIIKELFEKAECKVLSINYTQNRPAKIVLTHPLLPQYIIKIGCNKRQPRVNLTRVMVANKINELIDWPTLNIERIKKIQKKIYHRPNRPNTLTDFNYIVIAEKINGKPYDQTPVQKYKLTKKLNDDAYLIVNLITPPQAPYLEFSLLPENIFVTNELKVAFIDTEIEREYFKDKILDEAFSILNSQEINFIKQHKPTQEEQGALDSIFNNLNQKTKALLSGKFDFYSTKEISNLLTNDGFNVLQAHQNFVLVEHNKLPHYKIKIGINSNNQKNILSEVLLCDKINRIIADRQNNITLLQKISHKIYHKINQPLDLVDMNYVALFPRIKIPHNEYKSSIRVHNLSVKNKYHSIIFNEFKVLYSKLTLQSGHPLEILLDLSNMIMLTNGKTYILDLPQQEKNTENHLWHEALNFWPLNFTKNSLKDFFGFLLLPSYKK